MMRGFDTQNAEKSHRAIAIRRTPDEVLAMVKRQDVLKNRQTGAGIRPDIIHRQRKKELENLTENCLVKTY